MYENAYIFWRIYHVCIIFFLRIYYIIKTLNDKIFHFSTRNAGGIIKRKMRNGVSYILGSLFLPCCLIFFKWKVNFLLSKHCNNSNNVFLFVCVDSRFQNTVMWPKTFRRNLFNINNSMSHSNRNWIANAYQSIRFQFYDTNKCLHVILISNL